MKRLKRYGNRTPIIRNRAGQLAWLAIVFAVALAAVLAFAV